MFACVPVGSRTLSLPAPAAADLPHALDRPVARKKRGLGQECGSARTSGAKLFGGWTAAPAPPGSRGLGAERRGGWSRLRGRLEVLLLAEVEVFEVGLAAMRLELDGGYVFAVEHKRVAVERNEGGGEHRS